MLPDSLVLNPSQRKTEKKKEKTTNSAKSSSQKGTRIVRMQ